MDGMKENQEQDQNRTWQFFFGKEHGQNGRHES
jgi:hypothetical protein